MTTLGMIVTQMALCLGAALLIGAFFGYLYARAKSKEYYEHKIDALQEMCEAKKEEAEALKTQFGKLEIENSKLQEECEQYEELLVQCRTHEEELMTQLDVTKQENESLRQSLEAYEAKQAKSDEEESYKLLEKLTEIKTLLKTEASNMAQGLKEEIIHEIDKAEELVKNSDNTGKINTLIHTILGKFKPKK